MRAGLITVVVFLLFLCRGYAQSVISGRVTDTAGSPLSHVAVKIQGSGRGTTTGEDGGFRLERLQPGDYQLEISSVGFRTEKLSCSLTSGTLLLPDVVLKAVTVQMGEVVIEGGAGQRYEIIALPVRNTILEDEAIKQMPALSVSKLLSSVSGLTVNNEFGIFSSSSSVSLRGLGAGSQSGTLVVLDGIPLNKSDGGSVNWNLIDKDQIERIEVIKGPASALFGSNAMGGVINLISKIPEKKLGGKVSISSGTYRTLELKGDLNGTFARGLMYWKVFAHRRISDGYINTPDEIIRENDSIVVPVFLKEFFLGGLIGSRFHENHAIEVSFSFYDDIRGRGTQVYEEVGSNTDRDTYQAFIKYKGSKGQWRFYTNLFGLNERYFRLNEYFSDGAYTLYEVDARREDYGLRFWTEVKAGKKNELTFGLEGRRGMVHGKDIYYTSTDLITNRGIMDSYAFFIQDRLTFGRSKWTLVLGLRFDGAVFHDAAFGIEQPSYSVEYLTDFRFDSVPSSGWTALNPKLSLQYTPAEQTRLYLSLAKGFRAPVLDDLCRSDQTRYGFRVANPVIRPEHLYNVEAGIDQTFLRIFRMEFSAYYSAGYDFMYLLSTGDSVNMGYTIAPIYRVDNISRVSVYGLELDLGMNTGRYLKINAQYSFNHSTISRFVAETPADRDLSGKFLPNNPMHQIGSGLFFTCDFFDAALTLKYTGRRWILDDNSVDQVYLLTDRYPAYWIADFRISKDFGPLALSIDIDNLFNHIYINSRGYKSPGRMIMGKIVANLGNIFNTK